MIVNLFNIISNKNTLQIVIINLFILSTVIYSQGTVELTSFYSNSLGENRSIYVYLPEGYNSGDSLYYPVIYFLHGGGFGSYPYVHGILDNLISDGTIAPVIFVQPDGTGGPYYGGFYTNSVLNGNFEDYGTYDVVDFIDVNYRTIPSKEFRSLMGHSWGAYSCLKLAFKHPDIFGAVAAHSGTPDLNAGVALWRPHVLTENGGSPPYNYNPNAGVFSISMFGWAGAFSPNLNNSPYFVDFPLDINGVIVDSVLNRWQQHNPAVLASQLSSSTDLSIYFDCGTSDEYKCYPMNTAFADTLVQLSIPYTFLSYAGTHFNQLPGRFTISLNFLDSIRVTTLVNPLSRNDNLQNFTLYQNYPNPFNPTTTINYQISELGFAMLKVYDVLGNEIQTLVSDEKIAGSYQVEFNAENLTSGLYFYQLKTGSYVETKKMLFLK